MSSYGVVQNHVIRTKNKRSFPQALRLWFHKVLAELTQFDNPKNAQANHEQIEGLVSDLKLVLTTMALEEGVGFECKTISRIHVFTGSGSASISFAAAIGMEPSKNYEITLDSQAWISPPTN